MNYDSQNIFAKILRGEIPNDTVYEDDEVLAFRDINPQAPIHLLIIPKKHFSTVLEIQEEDHELIGSIYSIANRLAKKNGLISGRLLEGITPEPMSRSFMVAT